MFNSEEIQSSLNPKSQATDYETANYPPEHDCNLFFPPCSTDPSSFDPATSSGGSGSPEDAWSKSAQRGKHFPAHLASPNTAIHSPDAHGPVYNFTPLNSSGLPLTSPSTPVPTIPTTAPSSDVGSDPDSWESRNEALQRLNQRYRDNTKDL